MAKWMKEKEEKDAKEKTQGEQEGQTNSGNQQMKALCSL